ncbi:hypothetical protein PYW07_013055 [Mythimna separata]|uniref:THAP-type domain-containing protein n=1 Tax=Mythimna separata TaxID=271217 RepID=A0AAD7Y5N3_MYTSE|nr:hypothetical protein PYW07_013055 [Mythimna separata]
MRKIKCEICGLKNLVGHNKRVFMAKFPSDIERCKQWVKATGKESLAHLPIEKLHRSKYLCENHFQTTDFETKGTQLKQTAVPSRDISSTPLSDEALVEFPPHYVGTIQLSNGEPSTSKPDSTCTAEKRKCPTPSISEADGPQPVKKWRSLGPRGWVDTVTLATSTANELVVARGEHTLIPDESKQVASTNNAQAALNVAITCQHTGIISKAVAVQILADIQRKIIREACATMQESPGPNFNGRPQYTEGVLKLWCDNDHTLTWLKKTVSEVTLKTATSLVVCSQSEIPKRVRCGIAIPDAHGVFEDIRDIGRVLGYQNPCIDPKRWILKHAEKQGTRWLLILDIPEDEISTLMRVERRLYIGAGSVYLKFQGENGRFVDVPQGWDQVGNHVQEAAEIRPSSSLQEVPVVGPAVKAESTATGVDEGDPFAGKPACNGVPFTDQ